MLDLPPGSEPTAAPTITTIIVTFRRHTELFRTLAAVERQTAAIERIIIVDNDDDHTLAGSLSADHPRVAYVPSTSNLGPGGGFALGLRAARRSPTDWYWLLDDDSPPSGDSLSAALAVAVSTIDPRSDSVGAVGLRGGHVRRGRIRHDLRMGTVHLPASADFLLVDGSIVRDAAVRDAGLPREDFFIMMEDLEYTMRIRDAGWHLLVRPSDGSQNLYLGSGAPWRGYYQSRNHLRMAIERRSVRWMWGWLLREIAIDMHHLRHGRFRSIQFRSRGLLHALRNRMGRVVEPAEHNPPAADERTLDPTETVTHP